MTTATPLSVSVILGAGFSYVAGLPLTRDLYNTDDLPPNTSERALRNHEEVRIAWDHWSSHRKIPNAEEWLESLYFSTNPPGMSALWDKAVKFALAQLVRPWQGSKTPYYYGVTTSIESKVHREFWEIIRNLFQLKNVVTMNYDLLAEQGLRKEYTEKRHPPICYYGGWPYVQYVRVMKDLAPPHWEEVRLGEEVILHKMHGSLNWAREPHGLKIHDDVRAAFRVDASKGQIIVVPPVPEKSMPLELYNVWQSAEQHLAVCDVWLVCGYSLPEYDTALHEFFSRTAAHSCVQHLIICDPDAASVARRWRNIFKATPCIHEMPGLPDCFAQLAYRPWES